MKVVWAALVISVPRGALWPRRQAPGGRPVNRDHRGRRRGSRPPDRAVGDYRGRRAARADGRRDAQRANHRRDWTSVVEKVKGLGHRRGRESRRRGYNLQPEFGLRPMENRPWRGYVARNQVQVRIDTLSKTGRGDRRGGRPPARRNVSGGALRSQRPATAVERRALVAGSCVTARQARRRRRPSRGRASRSNRGHTDRRAARDGGRALDRWWAWRMMKAEAGQAVPIRGRRRSRSRAPRDADRSAIR